METVLVTGGSGFIALHCIDQLLEKGYKEDINIIDYEGLTLHEPEIINDLPAGGRRLVQKASGYDYTIVSGEVAFIKGEATGALNGRLIRNS